jgi:hypothetical protein
MVNISKIYKALLALLVLATASLTIPSAAFAHGHGNHTAGNLIVKHKPQGPPHHKHERRHGGGGIDDDDDDDDDDCKVVWTPKGPVVICDTDDDDDDDDDELIRPVALARA